MRANRSMPRCTVIPVLAYEDVGTAIEWLCTRFGFTERWRAGDHRAQLNVGDGAIVVSAQHEPPQPAPSRHSILVRFEDVDRHHDHARQHGARILTPPTDHPYGERQYSVEDLGGHQWTFSQSIADLAPEEWGGTSRKLD
jgi:uncharacterized glyoxalase superfamily protein PhnB